MINPHYKTLQYGLAKTLRELRQHPDVHHKLETQITFWHTVENLTEYLRVANPSFKRAEFVDEVMKLAGIESTPLDWKKNDPDHLAEMENNNYEDRL